MAPPTLFMYDTAGLNAHYALSRIRPWSPPVKPPLPRSKDLDRDASERWEEEGGSSAG